MSSISSILITLTVLAAIYPVVQSTPSRIVGGEQSDAGDFPYFVDMGGCGGTLIAPDAVLFAAHCGTRKSHQVVVGAYKSGSLEYKENDSSETYKAEARFCETWVPHPDYNTGNQNNDFALCRLNEAVNIDTTKTRLEFNFDSSVLSSNDNLIVMGTGALGEDEAGSTLLRDVTVPYIPNEECKTMYDGITDNMLCAGFKEGRKDSCQGDSGGPIVKRERQSDNTFIDYHVGVVSFGAGCARANKPGVYARTSTAKTWIEKTLQTWSVAPSTECNGVEIDVSVTTDTYGYETTVNIQEQDSKADAIFSRKYMVSKNRNDEKVCLPKNRCYTFEILDEYGDGLCFDSNECGNYKASYRGTQMFASSTFNGSSEQNDFCININGEQVDELDELPPLVVTIPPIKRRRRKNKKSSKKNNNNNSRHV